MATLDDANAKKLAEAIEICGDVLNPGVKGMNINSAITGLNVIDSEVIQALTAVCKANGTALVEALQIVEKHGGEMGVKSASRVRAELMHVMLDTAEKLWLNQLRPGWAAMIHEMLDAINLFDPGQISGRTNQSQAYFALVNAWRLGHLAQAAKPPIGIAEGVLPKEPKPGSKETIEKLFSLACKNENLGAAQLLYATGKIEVPLVGREAVKLWNPDNPTGKNKTNAWRELMRWLISTVVQKDAGLLSEYLADGWSELVAAWAKGVFIDARLL